MGSSPLHSVPLPGSWSLSLLGVKRPGSEDLPRGRGGWALEMTLPPADHPAGSKSRAHGPNGPPSANCLLNVLEKVNGRPAAVGAMDVLVVGDVWSLLSAGACSPGLLGLTLLWRNSSVPPGASPAAACHCYSYCGKVFIQQFPQEPGTRRTFTAMRTQGPGRRERTPVVPWPRALGLKARTASPSPGVTG